MIKERLKPIVQGFVIGSAMMIPGVSGGTIAIVVGIYDTLIAAVSNFFKDIKSNALFLVSFCFGAGLGFLLCSRILLYLVLAWRFPAMFFFSGAILGSIPILYKRTEVKNLKIQHILFFILGIALVLGLNFLPKHSSSQQIIGFSGFIILCVTGLITSFSLVLPGISTFHMLLVLGMYEPTLEAISQLNIPFLIPIICGALLGIFILARFIERAIKLYPHYSFFVIIGFVIGSIRDIFPGLPQGSEILACVISSLFGFLFVFFVTRKVSR